jgi:hypothetical protein
VREFVRGVEKLPSSNDSSEQGGGSPVMAPFPCTCTAWGSAQRPTAIAISAQKVADRVIFASLPEGALIAL